MPAPFLSVDSTATLEYEQAIERFRAALATNAGFDPECRRCPFDRVTEADLFFVHKAGQPDVMRSADVFFLALSLGHV
jgi:hypothetical protein